MQSGGHCSWHTGRRASIIDCMEAVIVVQALFDTSLVFIALPIQIIFAI